MVDGAGVLSSSTVQTITELNAQLESSCSGAQICVLTVEYLSLIHIYSGKRLRQHADALWGSKAPPGGGKGGKKAASRRG